VVAITAPKKVSLTATEVRTLKSRATGETYELSIALPLAYHDHESVNIAPLIESHDPWPVVYVLDANWYFGMVTDSVRFMSWGGRTNDAIIVGIGYPAEGSPLETWRKVVALRTHDLTPTQSDASESYTREWLKIPVKTGGGPEFLRFLRQEVIPLIDQEYRADPGKRILAGHSYGGGFALFAMLQEPGLFCTYVASSPSLDYADDYLFDLEAEYARRHGMLPAQVFLSGGELEQDGADQDETLANVHRFAAALESRKYEGFSLTKRVIPDYNHIELASPALPAGLAMALRR
jgi:hypothetical protein